MCVSDIAPIAFGANLHTFVYSLHPLDTTQVNYLVLVRLYVFYVFSVSSYHCYPLNKNSILYCFYLCVLEFDRHHKNDGLTVRYVQHIVHIVVRNSRVAEFNSLFIASQPQHITINREYFAADFHLDNLVP